MYAVRQIQQVENGKVVVQLPADFSATQVEVIILPAESISETSTGLSPSDDEQGKAAIQHFLTMDTSHFTEEQRKAYQRTSAILEDFLRNGHKPGDPPIFGVFEGLGWIADDFNEMSEEEIDLFYAGINTTDLETTEPQA